MSLGSVNNNAFIIHHHCDTAWAVAVGHCNSTFLSIGQFCYVDVCKDGLLMDQLIPLSNSVNSADAARLKELSLRGDRGTLAKKTLAEMLRGTLLLCKVFVGGKLELTEDQL